MAGLSTCVVVHNQDPSADFLLGTKIGTSPTLINDNLSVIRLETTKVCPFFCFDFGILLCLVQLTGSGFEFTS